MQCSRCAAQNGSERRYCAQCGTELARPCARCGRINAPGEGFCGGCGTPLIDRPSSAPSGAVEAERRQLTVMFCDLTGSTALSRRLDPEDLREVVHGFQQCVTNAVTRYDGSINSYLGDGVLAYFGFPRAHEDDAARAIHAALEIIAALHGRDDTWRALGVPALSARIGIATGLVVVSGNEAAMGETPNLAARLQALAEPDTVLVSRSTRDLAGGLFRYAAPISHELKGFSEPVATWQVLGLGSARSRFEASRSGRLTPLVGRESELDRLLDCWQRAEGGRGQAVLVVGAPGIGKSRMAEDMAGRVAHRGGRCLRYQCSPYRVNSALYPFTAELERTADVRSSDTPDQKYRKVQALLARDGLHDEADADVLAALLSIPLPESRGRSELAPEEQKERIFSALERRIRALARDTGLLVLFEDAHWIDPTSTELLDRLVATLAELRILIIVTSRDEPGSPWVARPGLNAIRLDPLDRGQATAMLKSVLGQRTLPAAQIEHVLARGGGIPLFIEELTKALLDSDAAVDTAVATPAAPERVPATLQDSLMARLDQLGHAKEVALASAIFGREFSRDLLGVLGGFERSELDDALGRLVAADILFQPDDPSSNVFVFKHALLRDAAYASLLRSKRQQLHRRTADTLVERYPDRVAVEPEVVAHHYTQAAEPAAAATYWAAAAQLALDRSANLEAVAHATKGLELLKQAPPSADRDRTELALQMLHGAGARAVSGFASSDAERSFARARELSEQLADVPRLIDARRGLFSCYYARGALGAAHEQGRAVTALGERSGAPASRMLGHWMSGCVMFWQGEFRGAQGHLEEAFALYDPREQRAKTLALQIDPGVNALVHLSWLLWILGEPVRAVDTSERAIRTARELAQPFALSMALFFAGATRSYCGDADNARKLLDELLALTAEHRLRYMATSARVLLARELVVRGEYRAGLEEVQQAFSEFAAQEAGVGFPWAMSVAASAYAGLGRVEEGLATLERAFAVAERNGERHWEVELWRLRGELFLLGPRDEARAESSLRRAIAVARAQSARSLELRATLTLAHQLLAQGKPDAARRALAPFCQSSADIAASRDLRDAAALLQGMGA